MDIKSDLGTANQKASELNQTATSLAQKLSVTEDGQTTVAGNANAKAAIQCAEQAAYNIGEAIFGSCRCINSVAENFQSFDESTSTNWKSSLRGLK